MKITVAGYWGAYPEKDGATSCYVVESEEETFLLDCGSGALAALPHVTSLNNINDVVVSHRHYDHVADLGSFVYSRVVAQGLKQTNVPLTIHAPEEEEEMFLTYEKEGASRLQSYKEDTELQIGSVNITFQETKHPAQCYAMKLEKDGIAVVYTADAVYDEALADFAAGADLLIAECSFYAAQDASVFGHMNSREAALTAQQAGVKELWLTHLPHFGEVKQLQKEAAEHYDGIIRLAERGLSWEK